MCQCCYRVNYCPLSLRWRDLSQTLSFTALLDSFYQEMAIIAICKNDFTIKLIFQITLINIYRWDLVQRIFHKSSSLSLMSYCEVLGIQKLAGSLLTTFRALCTSFLTLSENEVYPESHRIYISGVYSTSEMGVLYSVTVSQSLI